MSKKGHGVHRPRCVAKYQRVPTGITWNDVLWATNNWLAIPGIFTGNARPRSQHITTGMWFIVVLLGSTFVKKNFYSDTPLEEAGEKNRSHSADNVICLGLLSKVRLRKVYGDHLPFIIAQQTETWICGPNTCRFRSFKRIYHLLTGNVVSSTSSALSEKLMQHTEPAIFHFAV